MFDWLFEGRPVLYWLLGALAVVLLAGWWTTRKRGLLYGAGALAVLAGLYFVLDKLVETPAEQIERHLQEMAAAVKARDVEGVFRHVARDFHFRGRDRASFRGSVEAVLRGRAIDELTIYDVAWPPGGTNAARPVEFMAKPKGGLTGNEVAYPVRATFVREDDGQWRMKDFEVYNPVASRQPMDIPNWP